MKKRRICGFERLSLQELPLDLLMASIIVTEKGSRSGRDLATAEGLQILAVTMTDASLKPVEREY